MLPGGLDRLGGSGVEAMAAAMKSYVLPLFGLSFAIEREKGH